MSKEDRKVNNLFENTPIPEVFMKITIPVVMSTALTIVYNMVDIFFVSRTGNPDLVAGVALCAPLYMLMVAFGDVFGLGGASVISRLIGEGDETDARRVGIFCIYGAITAGILFFAVLLAAKEPILRLLGTDLETYEYARSYYRWIAAAAPFVVFTFVPTNLLRSEGMANEAMVGSVTGSIVNMVLDPFFIFGLHMGAAGAAIATLIGNACAVAWYLFFIMKKSRLLSMNITKFSASGSEFASVISIGIPASITDIMVSIATAVQNNYLLPYGNEKIAAMGIVSKITTIVIMIMVGFAFGGQPLYGYLYGKKNFTRLKEAMRFAYTLIIGISLALSVILFIASPGMMRIFMNNPVIVSVGSEMLRIVLIGMPFTAFVMTTTCIFQSAGKALPSLVLSAGRQGIFYVLVLIVAVKAAGYYGVISAQPIADIFSALVAFFLLKKTLMIEIE